MGIVNITPDSFSDGGSFASADKAVEQAVKLAELGADIIDFGAQSTRPGYNEISAEEEWERLSEALVRARASLELPLSVDTYFPLVAENALKTGVDIINDVSGRVNPKMAKIVKNWRCGWVLMHNGAGETAQVRGFFENATASAQAMGVERECICLDMGIGIGFGKSYEQSLGLISKIKEYKLEGYPLLLGASRKRVIGEGSRQEDVEKRVYGNISADAVAILGGVDIIRLHDVESERHGIYMADELKRFSD